MTHQQRLSVVKLSAVEAAIDSPISVAANTTLPLKPTVVRSLARVYISPEQPQICVRTLSLSGKKNSADGPTPQALFQQRIFTSALLRIRRCSRKHTRQLRRKTTHRASSCSVRLLKMTKMIFRHGLL